MPPIEIRHILEPHRLSLAWIPSITKGIGNRTWRRVGELTQGSENEPVSLRYLVDESDFSEAKKQGFQGYPAFPLASKVHHNGVLETFLKRLPPRSRGDFQKYLEMFRLPVSKEISDFALLGYTEARLPSDDFAILHHLEDFRPPFEVVLEVAGFRHEAEISTDELSVGAMTRLARFPHPMDENAIAVYFNEAKLGYLPRLHAKALSEPVMQDRVTSIIERINGSKDRPVVRVFLSVK